MRKYAISAFQFMRKFPAEDSARPHLGKKRRGNGVERPQGQADRFAGAKGVMPSLSSASARLRNDPRHRCGS